MCQSQTCTYDSTPTPYHKIKDFPVTHYIIKDRECIKPTEFSLSDPVWNSWGGRTGKGTATSPEIFLKLYAK